ncbi:unnamed protein product, partial [Ixodes persulcatus]
MDGSGRLFAGSWLRTHVLTGLITFCVLLFHSTPVRAGLYDGNLPLVNLNASNFYDVLLGKENAWIIQFYSSWCGHCIHFAPMFKAFAHDISGWRQVLGLAVMDCTEVTNIKFCRLFEVTSFPTLVFLGTKATRTDRGEVIEAHRSITNLRHQALSLLQGNHSTGPHPKPPSWPSLDPLPERYYCQINYLEEGAFPVLPLSNDRLAKMELIPKSGTEKNVFKVVATERRLESAISNLEAVPTAEGYSALSLQLQSSLEPSSMAPCSAICGASRKPRESTDTWQKTAQQQTLLATLCTPLRSHDPREVTVYRADLNNAMVYSLSQEVALWETFNRSQLEVLENFVDVLRQFFPGDPSTMHFLGRLQKYVASFRERGHVLRGEALSTFLHAAGSPDSRLPKMGPYVGCLGSRPGLRGYPCSLWVLFHSLTVNAYRASTE